jgi:hypothetical protein
LQLNITLDFLSAKKYKELYERLTDRYYLYFAFTMVVAQLFNGGEPGRIIESYTVGASSRSH